MNPTTHAPKTPAGRRIPAGYTAVTPWIISRDTARLLDFTKRAFAAEELTRMNGPDGAIVHAELRIGDAIVMAFDARPDWPPTPSFLRLYVDDCDAVFQRAVEAGAATVTSPTTLAFGARVGRVRDPLGNVWWVQCHLEDLTPDEMQRRSMQPEYAEAMTYVMRSLDEGMTSKEPAAS